MRLPWFQQMRQPWDLGRSGWIACSACSQRMGLREPGGGMRRVQCPGMQQRRGGWSGRRSCEESRRVPACACACSVQAKRTGNEARHVKCKIAYSEQRTATDAGWCCEKGKGGTAAHFLCVCETWLFPTRTRPHIACVLHAPCTLSPTCCTVTYRRSIHRRSSVQAERDRVSRTPFDMRSRASQPAP